MMLFVCNQGKYRSRTAYELYKDKLDCTYAGIYTHELPDADIIICMEKQQVEEIRKKYPQLAFNARIFCLDIPDEFGFMDRKLVRLIRQHMKELCKSI